MSTAKTAQHERKAEISPPNTTLRQPQLSGTVVVIVLLLAAVLFGLIRYRLRDVPLERDEGEYAYSGQLLLQGIPPYRLAYNMKLPGIYAAYAAMMAVFGQTATGIHLGLLAVNAATLVLLYLLAARMFGRLAGVVTACSWALLSTSSSVLGFEAHATNFVALPAILGILLLERALDFDNTWLMFLSGLCFGFAILMKQHGLFFALFGLLHLLFAPRHRDVASFLRRGANFAAAVAIPYAATCLLLYRANVLSQFWFWTVSYAGEYSKIGLRRAIRAFLETSTAVTAPAIYIWVLATFGLTALWWSRSARCHAVFILLLLGCSFLSLCPGGYFRPHYFILILPVIAMLSGVGVSAAAEKLAESSLRPKASYLPLIVFALCFGAAILHQRREFFVMDPNAVFASSYPGGPFFAAVQSANYIKAHSNPTDRIAVLGSEPEIYFYSQRHSATGYLYMYSLIVHQKYTGRMRQEFLTELKTNKPEYVVYVDVWDSWGERAGVAQAQPFLAQLQQYMNDGYERVESIDIGASSSTGPAEAARSSHSDSTGVIYVLRRKQDHAAP